VSGLVTFRLGQREYATPLSVVRLEGLTDLPGMVPPLAGVLDVRGSALPVLDLRRGAAGDRGDVLVLQRGGADGRGGLLDGGTVGVAVDQVRAVLPEGALPLAGAPTEQGVLPGYVVEVLRGASGVVFLIDLVRMVDSARTCAG